MGKLYGFCIVVAHLFLFYIKYRSDNFNKTLLIILFIRIFMRKSLSLYFLIHYCVIYNVVFCRDRILTFDYISGTFIFFFFATVFYMFFVLVNHEK